MRNIFIYMYVRTFAEGRWLHSQKELDSYSRFWFSRFGKHGSSYSFWPADSMLSRSSVTGNFKMIMTITLMVIIFITIFKRKIIRLLSSPSLPPPPSLSIFSHTHVCVCVCVHLFYFISGNLDLLKELLPAMIRFHEKIKVTNYDSKMGLYFNKDDRDGMEASIGQSTWSGVLNNTLPHCIQL